MLHLVQTKPSNTNHHNSEKIKFVFSYSNFIVTSEDVKALGKVLNLIKQQLPFGHYTIHDMIEIYKKLDAKPDHDQIRAMYDHVSVQIKPALKQYNIIISNNLIFILCALLMSAAQHESLNVQKGDLKISSKLISKYKDKYPLCFAFSKNQYTRDDVNNILLMIEQNTEVPVAIKANQVLTQITCSEFNEFNQSNETGIIIEKQSEYLIIASNKNENNNQFLSRAMQFSK